MRELRGMPVVKALAEKFNEEIDNLSAAGIVPRLAVVRVGDRQDDVAYEKGIQKRFSDVKALVDIIVLPEEVSQEKLEETVAALNHNPDVHGILIFRPLPAHLSEERLKSLIAQEKDVDCMGIVNTSYVFAGNKNGFPPCTPQAVIEMLEYYGIALAGKKVTIVGRSLVVGKPLSMLMLGKNATVTICHTKTADLAQECRNADILIACAGVAKMINAGFVHSKQIVIDVGINMLDGKLCGDVDYEAVADRVEAITPVPGGVGTVTTSVLLKHTIKSAMCRAQGA